MFSVQVFVYVSVCVNLCICLPTKLCIYTHTDIYIYKIKKNHCVKYFVPSSAPFEKGRTTGGTNG